MHEGSRYVVAFQKRHLSDALVPGITKILGEEGYFWLCCIASTNENVGPDGTLNGIVSVFRRQSWKGSVERFVRRAITLLRESSDPSLNTNLSPYVRSRHRRAVNILQNRADSFVHFELARNGEVSFSDIIHNSDDFSPRAYDDLIASQLFFFLKDITHKHQHHHESTDTIIGLYEAGQKENEWKKKVLYALYYQITELRRYKKDLYYGDALGMIAYAKAFYYANRESLLPDFYNDGIEASVRAAQDNSSNENSEIGRRSDSLRNIIIFIVGTVISLLSIGSSLPESGLEAGNRYIFSNISKFTYENLDFFLIAILLISVSLIIHSKVFFDWTGITQVRNYIRHINGIPRLISVSLSSAITTLFFIYSYLLISKSIDIDSMIYFFTG